MDILDGKNHHRGLYEKYVLCLVVELLNTGRHWGRLSHPIVAQSYSPDALRRADAAFLTTFRALIDQWIDSGINEDGVETPSSRYVRGLPRGYSESLFNILAGWLGRNMPKPLLSSDGTIGIVDQPPNHYGLEAEAYAREQAIYHFKELLASPVPHRLGKCKNCRTYFARKRERKGDIKRGTYCGNCELIGAAERTRLSRKRRKNQQLDAAAKAWLQWTKSNNHPSQSEWIAKQVNKQVRSGTQIQAKWVTQNKREILERLNAHSQAPTIREDQQSHAADLMAPA